MRKKIMSIVAIAFLSIGFAVAQSGPSKFESKNPEEIAKMKTQKMVSKLDLTDEQALFLTDILPTSYWGVEKGGVKIGDTVVMLGCGPVGLLSQKWATYMGADSRIAVDYGD